MVSICTAMPVLNQRVWSSVGLGGTTPEESGWSLCTEHLQIIQGQYCAVLTQHTSPVPRSPHTFCMVSSQPWMSDKFNPASFEYFG